MSDLFSKTFQTFEILPWDTFQWKNHVFVQHLPFQRVGTIGNAQYEATFSLVFHPAMFKLGMWLEVEEYLNKITFSQDSLKMLLHSKVFRYQVGCNTSFRFIENLLFWLQRWSDSAPLSWVSLQKNSCNLWSPFHYILLVV